MIATNKTDTIEIDQATPTFQVSYYKEGEEEDIVNLLIKEIDGWPVQNIKCSPLEHWMWKHLDSPTGLMNVVVAWSNGKIVGCNHSHTNTAKIFDKKIPSEISCDLAVHSDYRKMGIYKTMSDLSLEKSIKLGITFGYWITVNPILINRAKKLDRPTPPFHLVKLIWINNIDEYFRENHVDNALVKKTLLQIKTSLQQIFNKTKRSSDYDIKDITYFGYEAEIFWRKVSPGFDLIIERNQEYLNYRYCDSRAGNYKVKAVYRREEMLGYCVLDLTQGNQAKILDFITISGEMDAADTLLLHVLDYVAKNKRKSVILWLVYNSEFYRIFMRNNFVKAKNIGPHLYFNSRVVEMEEWNKLQSLNPERVHFVLGDTDIC